MKLPILTSLLCALLICADASAAGDEVDMTTYCASRAARSEPRYPQRALEQMVNGRAVLECVAPAEGGQVGPCRVVDEAPEEYGFGRSAIRTACGLTVETLSPISEERIDDHGRRIVRIVMPFNLRRS